VGGAGRGGVCEHTHDTWSQHRSLTRANTLSAPLTAHPRAGYSSLDLVTTFFKVVKGMDSLPEALKLDFLAQVSGAHMRVVDGVGSLLQMQGLASKLSGIAREGDRGGAAGARGPAAATTGAGAGSSSSGGGLRF
jgi:hypothetical protein